MKNQFKQTFKLAAVGMAIAQVDRELDNVAIIRQIKGEKTTRLDKD